MPSWKWFDGAGREEEGTGTVGGEDTSASELSIGGGEYHLTLESKSAGSVVLYPLFKSLSSETRTGSEVTVGEIVKANENA